MSLPADPAAPTVRVYGLTKIYTSFLPRRRVTALSDVTFSVPRGQVYGLLGPNGSGKTTTIKLLLGLIFATRGTIRVLDAHPRDVAVKARIGYLPEESYLYRFLNAEETLDFYGRLFDMPKALRRERTQSLLDLVGLAPEARTRPVGQYSKGMARRLGLAQALINDPELVILDEPTSGMDPIGTAEIKDLIRRLRSEGRTVILSSHLLADTQDVCDRIAILHNGILRREGTLAEALTRSGEIEIRAKGLSAEDVSAIEQAIKERGGEVLSTAHPRETLESLFLRVVAESGREKSERRGS
jgi:ABC-2 type transport system ATP-binding protein